MLGIALGFLIHRSRFCTMGAVADCITMQDSTRLRIWALAIAVATAGLHLGVLLADWNLSATLYVQPTVPVLSHAVGGLLFGAGMVQASGCGSQSLVRMGSGNLKSAVVVLVMGVTALITLKGVLAPLRVYVLNPVALNIPAPATVPGSLAWALGLEATGAAALRIQTIVPFVLALLLAAWALASPPVRQVRNVTTGTGIGLCITAAWFLTLDAGFQAENPETLEPVWLGTYTGKPEALTFTAPIAHVLEWLAYGSDSARRFTMGMAAVMGVVAGAHLSVRTTGHRAPRFHWEGFRHTDDLIRHLRGGVLMGFGGVLGLGCSVGQGLSGVSTLSIGAWVTLASMLAGATWQLRRDYARI